MALAKRRAQAAWLSMPSELSLSDSLATALSQNEIDLLARESGGGICRMLLTPFHRKDQTARDEKHCDDLARDAKAIEHRFVPR